MQRLNKRGKRGGDANGEAMETAYFRGMRQRGAEAAASGERRPSLVRSLANRKKRTKFRKTRGRGGYGGTNLTGREAAADGGGGAAAGSGGGDLRLCDAQQNTCVRIKIR